MRTTMPKHGASLLWSTRQISLYFSWAVIGYVTFFCSDVLGLNTAIVGTLLLVSKILDAISNFIAAYIVDNAHFKLGKGRPWEINMIPMWISLMLIFFIPPTWGDTAKYIMVFVFYSLEQAVFNTFVSCTDTIYFKRAFKDEETRNKVQAVTGALSTVALIAGSIVMPLLIDHFSKVENGWRIMALLVGVPMMLIGMIRFFTIPEIYPDDPEKQDHVSVKDTLSAFVGNKYVLIITLMYFGLNFYNAYVAAPETYYVKWIMGDITLQSLLTLVSLAAIVIIPVCLPMANKIGRVATLRIFYLLAVVACVVKFFFGTNLILLCVMQFLGSLFIYPFNVFSPLMLIDSMDYGQWKSGKVVEGAVFAATSLGSTIGNGVGAAVSGLALGFFGYDGTVATQTAGALFGIRFSFAVIPAILVLLIFIVLQFFDLEEKMPQIKEELEARK